MLFILFLSVIINLIKYVHAYIYKYGLVIVIGPSVLLVSYCVVYYWVNVCTSVVSIYSMSVCIWIYLCPYLFTFCFYNYNKPVSPRNPPLMVQIPLMVLAAGH